MARVVGTVGPARLRRRRRRTIRIYIEDDKPYLRLDTKQFPKMFADGDLANYNQQFVQALEELRLVVQENGITLAAEQRTALLQTLRELGTTVPVSRSVTGLSLRVIPCRQGMATLSYLLSGRRCLSGSGDGLESGAVVVPAGSGLVESSA